MDAWQPDEAPRPKRHRRLFAALAALVVAAFVVANAPSTVNLAPPRPVGDEAVAFFDRMALMRGAEGGAVDRPGSVRKFIRPVTIVVRGRPDPAFRSDAAAIAATLTAWTGLAFALADRPAPGHGRIVVHVQSHADIRARYGARGPVCMTRTWGHDGRLHVAVIDVSARFTDCLAHEMMHAVGFDNHWTGPLATGARLSVLAQRFRPARARAFSPWDEMAIRLLYDWRLPAGTGRDVALPMARAILTGAAEG